MKPSARLACLIALAAFVAVGANAQLRKPTPAMSRPRAEKLSGDLTGVVSGAVVRTDSSGVVRRVRGSVSANKSSMSTVDAAAGFLSANSRVLGLSSTLSELVGDRAFSSLGGSHVVYHQVYHGLPVFGTSVGVHFDHLGNIQQVNNGVKPLVDVGDLSYLLSARAAIVHAENFNGQTVNPRHRSQAEKGVLAVNGIPKAVFKVTVNTILPSHSWESMVDAATGEVLQQRDLLQHVNGTGSVFDPNPVATSGVANLNYDNTQAPVAAITAQQQTVTLQGLDGSGFLTGTFADTSSSTQITRAQSNTLTFNYNYLSPNFDETMAYYHVDTAQRYIQSLGFTNINNRQVKIDVDGIPEDNSFYSPVTKELTFGSGGVPDANDADVIWHEYGHSIQDNQVPDFGSTTDESAAMGEGFGDYWAFQHGAGIGPNSPAWDVYVFKWDATTYNPGTPAFLRRVDSTKHYPEDFVVSGDPHDNGELWSASLKQVFDLLGKTDANKVILQSQFALAPDATFADASNSIVAAYQSLFPSGTNGTALRNIFVARGFLSSSTPTAVTTSVSTIVGGNDLSVTVTLSAAASAGYTINLSSNNTAVVPAASFAFPAGATTSTFALPTKGVDSSKIVQISASANGGTATSGSVTVTRARLFSVRFSSSTVTGGSPTYCTVSLDGAVGTGYRAVNLTSNNSAATVPATIYIAPQTSSVSFTVSTAAVTSAQTVTITATSEGTVRQGILTVRLKPQATRVALSSTSFSGGNRVYLAVYLDVAAPTGGMNVPISSTVPGANIPTNLYVVGGSNSGLTYFTPTAVDTSVSGSVTATSTPSSISQAFTLQPANLTSLTISPTSVNGGSTSLATLRTDGLTGPSGRVVTLASNNAGVVVPASVTIPAGRNVLQFLVNTTGVSADTTATVTATSTQVQTATLQVKAGVLTSVTGASSVTGGSPINLTVVLSAKAGPGGQVVNLSSSSARAVTPATVTVPAGATSATFAVRTTGGAATTATITAQITGGVAVTKTFNIN